MPLPAGLKIYITSADGTRRRRLPRVQVETVTTTIDRFGGYGQGTVTTAIPYHQAGALIVLPGDRVETWYAGVRRYRGYVSAIQPSGEEPRKVVIQTYGAAALLKKQSCNKAYAFPSGGVDVSQAFAQMAHDALLKATGPNGFPLIQSTQILPVGQTINSLDARRKLAGDVLDALIKETGNLAVWGVDVDAAGGNRLYLRPLSPASPPTHAIPVPARYVETASGEQQTADIVNQLFVTGGMPMYPNLLHNGGYELPVQQADGAGNLVVNGGFETATDDHHVSSWTMNGGAQSFTTFSFPPKEATPYSGTRCLGLEGTGQSATQASAATFVAGHNYVFSVRAAKEIDQQVATGHAALQITGGGAVLLTQAVALTPSGQGYDFFSGTFIAPAGATGFSVTIACDTLDASGVAANNGYSGGLLIDDVQLYDVSVVYQDGWYVNAIDTAQTRVNAVNWVYQDSVFEGGYSVYLDATGTDSDGHDLKLQPPAGNRYKVQGAQALRYGVWVKSPPASLNPNPPKFFLEMNFYDSSGHITRTPPRATFTPGFLAQWTYFELVAYALAGETAGDANLTWRSPGSLLVDAQSVRDAQAPAMAAANGATVPLAPYLPDGPLVYFIKAGDPYLNNTWRPANGYAGAAPYAASEALYGPRCGVFSDPSVLRLEDAMAVANGTFTAQGLPLYRPSVTLVNDSRLYWPGETVNLIGADGPTLSPTALPIARVQDTYDGLLKTRLEDEAEQPDVSLVIKKLVQAAINRLGPGQSGGGGGGGYSGAAGGGTATSPVFRSSLQASPTDPTLHDAYTGAPHASQASQSGWTGTTGEVVAARTRTVKGVSGTTLETRLDAMEADITAKEPGLGNPSTDGYILSSTAAGARAWGVPQAGPQGPTGAAGAQGPAGTGGSGATITNPLPTPGAGYRGQFYLVDGSTTGNTDGGPYICVRTATGGYQWEQISAAGYYASAGYTKPGTGTTLNTAVGLANGLVGAYLFNENAGTVLHDYSGNANGGTLVGSPTWVVGPDGPALNLNGSGQYATIPSTAANNITTLTAVICTTMSSAPATLLEKWQTSGGGFPFSLRGGQGSGGDVTGAVYDTTNNPSISSNGKTASDGGYHQVLFTRTNRAAIGLWLDGTSVATGTDTTTGTTTNSTAIWVGGRSNNSVYLTGKVNWVYLYNRVLSSSEIASLYTNPYQMFH